MAGRSKPLNPQQLDFLDSTKRGCHICSYTRAIDRCHIIPRVVAGYSSRKYRDKLLAFEGPNIIYLCKNCHWNFDRGTLEPWERETISIEVSRMYNAWEQMIADGTERFVGQSIRWLEPMVERYGV